MGHIKSPAELNVASRARQELTRRNLFDNAMKRMQEYLDKQKKSTERQKKVLEFQKYVKKQANEKFEHREEFVKTANDHNTGWKRTNLQKVNRVYKQSMGDIKDR